MITDDDARMVAERLGLPPEDVPEVQAALEDIALRGQDGFEDQVLTEAYAALRTAREGQPPSASLVRRVEVRKTLALALRQFTTLRNFLVTYDGPTH
jgi:hypothetical protein